MFKNIFKLSLIKIKVSLVESAVYKIRRTFVRLVLLLGIGLASWIYWKSNAKLKENRIIWDFVTRVSLQPIPSPCKSNTFLIIIVTSYVGHEDQRMAHRILTPEEELRKINATRVFLLAQIPPEERYLNQSTIIDESENFGDLLQGTFIENYRNLTYKHLMGLKWASTICRDASFILKVDDDTVYKLRKTYAILKTVDYSTSVLLGYINNTTKPVRKKYKWYVTRTEYPRRDYPAFLSGWYYITTPQVAAALCDEAIYHPYFWIDDVFITGLLPEALGLKLTNLPRETFWSDNFLNCRFSVQTSKFECKI